MSEIKKWWNIIRPKTLFASLCPVLTALFLSLNQTRFEGGTILIFVIVLLCALSLQILSNLINDYYDYKKGADKKGRVGFKRALAEGVIRVDQVRRAIYLTLATSILLGIVLICFGGIPILLIGVSAIIFAWLYTATNHSLSYLGIADVFCFLYYGIFAVCGTYYLLTDMPLFSSKSVVCVGAICGLISMMVLMINNLRDIEDDRQVGKKTLPVRFGKRFGEYAILLYSLLMLVLSFLAFGLSLINIIFIPAYMLYQEIATASGDQYNKCLFKAGLLNLFFVFLLLLEVLL
jgi:1,4-dihydroxy-2-naphthoate polyprenyltransferase